MRLLILQSSLGGQGGAERWLLSLLRLQPGRHHLLLGAAPQLPEEELALLGGWSRCPGLRESGLRRGRPGQVEQLRRELEARAPDLVLVNDVVHPALLSAVADTGRGVVMVQDHRAFCPGPGRALPAGPPCAVAAAAQTCARCFPEEAGELLEGMLLLTEARAAALRRMRALLVLSTYMAQELCTAGIPGAEVFPPWVDSLPAGPLDPAAGLQHLLAGRLTWHKGVDLALAASEVGLPLALAGRGPLEEVARAAGHRCLGWLDRAGLAAALGQSRSLWMPGRWAEPWGIAGLEAQWMGLPVLASAVGGVAEWLEHGEGGLLLPPNDAVALREAATQLSRDPALARRLGRRGCERARAEAGPQRGWALWQRLEEWAGGRGERR